MPDLLILYRLDTRIAHIRVVSVVYFDFPSMKRAEIVDEKFKNYFPSMKRAENVDGKFKNQFPSMKRAENVDGKFNILHRLNTLPHVSVPRQVPILIPSQLPDLKPDLLQKLLPVHEKGRNRGWEVQKSVPVHEKGQIMDGKFVSCWPCVHEGA